MDRSPKVSAEIYKKPHGASRTPACADRVMAVELETGMQNLEKLRHRLATGMTGRVSLPGEPAYRRAISIWARPKILPRLVAHCANAADVQLAVRSARESGIALSVRGGGHDWTGRALCDGLTLDLSQMNAVGPIRGDKVIEVGGGARGTDVYAVTDPAGVSPVLGSVADIGVSGLVTGGGYGPLMRRYGLACDNLHSATVVLADGRSVRAAEDGDDELFWAIRGGGGNFGVVTSLELRVQPVATVRSGVMLFPFESGAFLLPRLRAIWESSPPELDVQFGIVPSPDGTPVLYISPTWSGEADRCEDVLASLYAFETCMMADVHDQPFGRSRAFFDRHIVNGRLTSADTVWLREWNEETSRIVMEAMRYRPSPLCFVLCHDFSGAATKIAPSDTAFGLREAHIWFEVIAPTDPDSTSDGSAEAQWASEVAESLAPHSFPGGYPNLLGPHRQDRIQRSFGDNASRLIRAKKKYDPENIFRSTITLPIHE